MSVRVMSEVFIRYENGGSEMLLALALADHAHDDGTHIWPSVSALAEKTRQNERTVQRQLRKMEVSGWLIRVADKNIGRGKTVKYCINPDWIKGDKLSPFKKERVTNPTVKGDKSCIAYKEEPSIEPPVVFININTPPLAPSKKTTIEFDTADGLFKNITQPVMQRWEEAYPKLDIDAELTRAELWYVSNPRKRKKNHHRFITNWLARAHDRVSAPRSPYPKQPPAKAAPR